jgi:hypothetical protein
LRQYCAENNIKKGIYGTSAAPTPLITLTPPSLTNNSPDSKNQTSLKQCHPILEAGKKATEKLNESNVLFWNEHEEQHDSSYFDNQKELTDNIKYIALDSIVFSILKQDGMFVILNMNKSCYPKDHYNFYHKLLLNKLNFINKENAEICATNELEAENQSRLNTLRQNNPEQSQTMDNTINWNPKYQKIESVFFNNNSLLSSKINYIDNTGTIFKIQ